MTINKALTRNLIILHSETFRYDGNQIQKVRFICQFFGECYYATISKKNVDRDWCGVIECEGPSELFESFSAQMEDQWEEIKELFAQHVQSGAE